MGGCSLSQLLLGERQDPPWMSSSQDQHNETNKHAYSHSHLRTIRISSGLPYQQTLSVLKNVQLNRMSCRVTCKSFQEVELSFFQNVLCMDAELENDPAGASGRVLWWSELCVRACLEVRRCLESYF